MKHILFFVCSMEGGGAERVAALLCNRWVAQGYSVTLVPTFSGRGTCVYQLDGRVRLVYLADRVGTKRKTPLTRLRRLWAMRQLVRESRADVVLSFLTHVNVAALAATYALGVPVVVSERTFPPAREIEMIWQRLRPAVYPWAKRVVMQTMGGLDWLEKEIPSARGMVVQNPCVFPLPEAEPKILPETIVRSDRHILLAVGRLVELKQFDLLIAVFVKLAGCFPDWDLAILGEGEDRASLEAQVAVVGMTGRVHLPGRVGNIGDWYKRADLYAMSSRFEGFPNSLLEALAHGLPVVSLDCATGPSDLIREGVNGYLVSPEAGADGLVARLAQLMADSSLRADMSVRAFDVRDTFSFERVGVAWDNALCLIDSA